MQYDIDIARELIESMRPTSTWSEVAQELNAKFGINLDESTYRKNYNALGHETRRKIALEKQYLRYERAKNYEDIRDISLKSMLTDDVREALLSKAPIVQFNKDFYDTGDALDEYVFVTSDFHYDGDETLLQHLASVYTHIRTQQKQKGFKRIKLIELGDTIDGGALRTSQLMAIKKGMVFQIIDVSKAYAGLIHKLSETMLVDFYCVTSSNHTQLRPLGTKQNQLVEEDLMHIFATYIEISMSKNANVKVTYANEMVIPVTTKHKMFVSHGHLIGNKKEGYLQELAFHRGIQIEYGLFGHFHHYREITLYAGDDHNKKVFYAPSMSTVQSQFELDKNMSSKAAILMLVFSHTRGHRYSEELFL